jgi:hypothetical protein
MPNHLCFVADQTICDCVIGSQKDCPEVVKAIMGTDQQRVSRDRVLITNSRAFGAHHSPPSAYIDISGHCCQKPTTELLVPSVDAHMVSGSLQANEAPLIVHLLLSWTDMPNRLDKKIWYPCILVLNVHRRHR